MTDWVSWIQNPFKIKDLCYKECGGNGNCQFLSIAESLKGLYTYTGDELRQLASKQIMSLSTEEFQLYINEYQRQKNANTFVGKWDPFKVRSRRILAHYFVAPITSGNGYDFQGDEFSIFLLSKALKINIYVFNLKHKYILNTSNNEHPFSIFLLYKDFLNFQHYQCLAWDLDSDVQSIFKKNELPQQVLKYLIKTKQNL